MVEAVSRNGYDGMTLRELASLAGVSGSAFNQHFDSKQECFLATFDEIVALATERIGAAYRSESGLRKGLNAAFEELMDILTEEPAATHLVVVDSLSLGAAGVARRQRLGEIFELMFRQSFAQEPERGEVSDLTIRAIVGGIRRVVYGAIQRGEFAQLREHVDELLDWGLSYQRPGGASASRLPATAFQPISVPTEGRDGEPGLDEPPDSPLSRSKLTQRERIVRAAAKVADETGFESLSIPAITSTAGVSNQTFYEHFRNTEEAFMAALDMLGPLSWPPIVAATETHESWADTTAAGLRTLLTYIAENPLFARLAFIEGLTAGSPATDRASRITDWIAAQFNLNVIPADVGTPQSELVIEAIGGGIWIVIQNEVAAGRTNSLPDLTPEIAYILMAPFGAV